MKTMNNRLFFIAKYFQIQSEYAKEEEKNFKCNLFRKLTILTKNEQLSKVIVHLLPVRFCKSTKINQ